MDTTTALAAQEPLNVTPLAIQSDGSEIGQILMAALDKGIEPASMRELVACYKEMHAMKAQREFSAALAKFKAECPTIPRRHDSQFFKTTVTEDGRKIQSPRTYADLDDIQTTIDPVLTANGLSYTWGKATLNGQAMEVPCVLEHIGGGKREASVPIPFESNAGCSPAQKYGIAHTYARRYSLVAVTGIRTTDIDVNGAEPAVTTERVTEDQTRTINDLLIESGADVDKFKAAYAVAAIADLPATRFDRACGQLNKKIEAKRRGTSKPGAKS